MTDRGHEARHRWMAAATVALTIGASACGGGDPPDATTTSSTATTAAPVTTSTVPERPASTTTTEFAPTTVEGQVEAAYLRSWDVYADAVYDLELDEARFAEVYGNPLLSVRVAEVNDRVAEGRASLVDVDHHYEVHITAANRAVVIDRYINHQVQIDPRRKTPVEKDPNKEIVDVFSLESGTTGWVVVDQRRL